MLEERRLLLLQDWIAQVILESSVGFNCFWILVVGFSLLTSEGLSIRGCLRSE